MQQGNGLWIYWEKQGTDRLCAVHCVNSLLQGPFNTEVSSYQIFDILKYLSYH